MVFLHAHEGRVAVGLGERLAPAHVGEVPLVALHAGEVVVLDQPLGLLERLVLRGPLQALAYPPRHLLDVVGRRLAGLGHVAEELVLLVVQVVDLVHERADPRPQLLAVPLGRLAPGERVLVGVGLDLRAVEEVGVERHVAELGEHEHHVGEYVLEGAAQPLGAEPVYRHVVQRRAAGQPQEVDVGARRLGYPARGVDAARVSVDDDLEHHARVVGRGAPAGVERPERREVQRLDDLVDDARHVVPRHHLGQVERQQPHLVLAVGLEGRFGHRKPPGIGYPIIPYSQLNCQLSIIVSRRHECRDAGLLPRHQERSDTQEGRRQCPGFGCEKGAVTSLLLQPPYILQIIIGAR